MVMVMMVLVIVVPPRMMHSKISVIPIPAALVVSVNPAMTIPMTGHPDPMPAIIPEVPTLVVRSIADDNLKVDCFGGGIESRARAN